MARDPALDGGDLAFGEHDLRRPHRLLPRRRAARPRAALGDREGKAEALAVSALTAARQEETSMTRMIRTKAAALALAVAGAVGGGPDGCAQARPRLLPALVYLTAA